MSENQMPEKVELTCRYNISLEEYLEYNHTIADLSFGKKKKSTTLLGILELIISAALLYYMLSTDTIQWLYVVLLIIVFAAGIYGSLFYTVIFPQMLKRSVTKNYASNEYLQEERQISMNESFLTDASAKDSANVYWDDVLSVVESQSLFMVMFDVQRGILISKQKVDEETVREFLKKMMDINEKDYIVHYTSKNEKK